MDGHGKIVSLVAALVLLCGSSGGAEPANQRGASPASSADSLNSTPFLKALSEVNVGKVAGSVASLIGEPERLPENMVYIRISESFLKRLADQEVSRRRIVSDNILGTPVSGVSQTVGRTELVLQPNDRAGVAYFRLSGTVNSDTVGHGGAVEVFSHGVTDFQAVKTIWLDGRGIHFTPSQTVAHAHTTVQGMTTSLPGLRGRIALRIGGARVADRHAAAEQVISEHVARQVDRQFDELAESQFAEHWRLVSNELAALPLDSPIRPRGWFARTHNECLEIVLLGPPNDGSEYVAAPTTQLGTAGVKVDVHAAVLKAAMTDPAAQRLLRMAAAFETTTFGDVSTMPSVAWSDHSRWLSLSWSANPREPPQTAPNDAPTATTARRNPSESRSLR